MGVNALVTYLGDRVSLMNRIHPLKTVEFDRLVNKTRKYSKSILARTVHRYTLDRQSNTTCLFLRSTLPPLFDFEELLATVFSTLFQIEFKLVSSHHVVESDSRKSARQGVRRTFVLVPLGYAVRNGTKRFDLFARNQET